MSEMLLQVNDVTMSIDRRMIIEGLSMSMASREVTVLEGPNGVGKSTLLKLIAGILRPTCGTIRVNGLTAIADRIRYAAQIGYMPDEFQFNSTLCAREQLQFWANLRGVDSGRIDELLKMTGLLNDQHRPVTQYSKGMRQRFMFAQAQLAKPPLLILDEPDNGLDQTWLDQWCDWIKDAVRAGQSVVFSTHRSTLKDTLADHVVRLEQNIRPNFQDGCND